MAPQQKGKFHSIVSFVIKFSLYLQTMDNRQQYIQLISNASPYIRSEFGVKSLQLFGSMARGEATDLSDIDIFVEMPPKAIKVVALKQYLQKLLGRAVDIVRSHSNIDPYLINEIQRDGITIIA